MVSHVVKKKNNCKHGSNGMQIQEKKEKMEFNRYYDNHNNDKGRWNCGIKKLDVCA